MTLLAALVLTGGISATVGSPKGLAAADIELSDRCPPSFELTDGDICRLRTLYDWYSEQPGSGGLRVALPPARDGFSPQQIDLGRYLFFDPILSRNHDVACARCHSPSLGFSDGRPGSIVPDAQGQRHEVARNAPSLWNVAFLQNYFWDTRAHSLEEQAMGPLLAPNEMANTIGQIEGDLNSNVTYRRLFRIAYAMPPATGISMAQVTNALAAFECSLISLNSKYDRYAHGDQDALNENEKHGLSLFRAVTLGCSQCHTPPLFASDEVAVTGVPAPDGKSFDAGAGPITGQPMLRGAFKIPTLRNIEKTAPYMHAGQFKTLNEVVQFYNDKAGHAAPASEGLHIDWRMILKRPVLTRSDSEDLESFLLSLSDESMLPVVPDRVPSGLSLGS